TIGLKNRFAGLMSEKMNATRGELISPRFSGSVCGESSKAALSVVTCVSTLMSSFLAKRTGTAPYPFWNIFCAQRERLMGASAPYPHPLRWGYDGAARG